MPLRRFLTYTVRIRIDGRDEADTREDVAAALEAMLDLLAEDGVIDDAIHEGYSWSVGTSEEQRPDA